MVYESLMLNKISFEELLSSHEEAYNEEVKFYEEFDKQEKERHQKELEKFKKKNPFLYKDVSELTFEDKAILCNQEVNNQINYIILSNEKVNKKSLNEIYEKYNPQKISDEDLISIQKRGLLWAPKVYIPSRVETLKESKETFCFKISKNDIKNSEIMQKLEVFSKKLLKSGNKVRIAVNDEMENMSNDSSANYLYSKEDLEVLIGLNNRLAEEGMTGKGIVFDEFKTISSIEDYKQAWGIEDVIKANNEIERIASDIKKMEFSPFEAMVYIHSYLTKNYAYAEGDTEQCRVIPGIIKDGKIVCSGYASFVKSIVDKLNIPELKCDIVGCEMYARTLACDFEGGHCHNLIKITDKKYNINGYYIEDACWDAKTKKYENGRGFAHCLYPVSDLEHISGMHYVQYDGGSRLSNLIYAPEDVANAVGMLAKLFKGEKLPSAFSEYRKRRAKIKLGSQIVKRFANQSKAIPRQCYKEALTELHTKVLGNLSAKSEERIEKDMENSVINACATFDKKASIDFASDRKSVKQLVKQRNSLQANDGRDK